MTYARVEKRTREFAEYFFDKVMQRLVQAGAEPLYDSLPKIKFVRPITKREVFDLTSLEIRTLNAINQLKKEGIEYDPKKHSELLDKELGPELAERRRQSEELFKAAIMPETAGSYSSEERLIRLNKSYFREKPRYFTIAHELLHAARDCVSGVLEENQGYQRGYIGSKKSYQLSGEEDSRPKISISPEDSEFFSEHTRIIVPQICSPKYDFLSGEEPKKGNLTLKNLRANSNRLPGNIAGIVIKILDLYMSTLQGSPRKTRDSTSLDKLSSRISKGGDFLNLVYGVSELNYEYLHRLLRNLYENFDSNQGKDITTIVNDNIRTISSLAENINRGDKNWAYNLAVLAINEHKEVLEKSWPEVFLMSAEEMHKIYINPVVDAIRKIRSVSKPKRKENKRNYERLLKMIGKASPKYHDLVIKWAEADSSLNISRQIE